MHLINSAGTISRLKNILYNISSTFPLKFNVFYFKFNRLFYKNSTWFHWKIVLKPISIIFERSESSEQCSSHRLYYCVRYNVLHHLTISLRFLYCFGCVCDCVWHIDTYKNFVIHSWLSSSFWIRFISVGYFFISQIKSLVLWTTVHNFFYLLFLIYSFPN